MTNPITEALRRVDGGCETCDGEMRVHHPPWSSGTVSCPSPLHAAARELVEACARTVHKMARMNSAYEDAIRAALENPDAER